MPALKDCTRLECPQFTRAFWKFKSRKSYSNKKMLLKMKRIRPRVSMKTEAIVLMARRRPYRRLFPTISINCSKLTRRKRKDSLMKPKGLPMTLRSRKETA